MRWTIFLVVALAAVILQVGTSQVLGLGEQRVMPDLLLLVALVVAFRGPREEALLACWGLGLLKDLTSVAPLGAYAVSFGVLAWVVVGLREWLYGPRLLPQVVVLLAGGLFVEHVVWWVCLVKGVPVMERYWGFLSTALLTGGLTAALYPYGLWVLTKLGRALGLEGPGRFRMLRGR